MIYSIIHQNKHYRSFLHSYPVCFGIYYCMGLHTWRFLEIFVHDELFWPKLGIFAVLELLDVISFNCFRILCY